LVVFVGQSNVGASVNRRAQALRGFRQQSSASCQNSRGNLLIRCSSHHCVVVIYHSACTAQERCVKDMVSHRMLLAAPHAIGRRSAGILNAERGFRMLSGDFEQLTRPQNKSHDVIDLDRNVSCEQYISMRHSNVTEQRISLKF
jgi:hypothetical protein